MASTGSRGRKTARASRSLASDADQKVAKDRKDHLGEFEVVRKEYTHSHIWTFDVAEALKEPGHRDAAH